MKRNWAGIAGLLGVVLVGVVAMRVVLPSPPPSAEIREVWEHHEVYEGKSLRVSGTLKRFLAGRPKDHYVVESADGYRIGVEAAALEALEGVPVTAVGEVTFDEESGLRLEPATVTAR